MSAVSVYATYAHPLGGRGLSGLRAHTQSMMGSSARRSLDEGPAPGYLLPDEMTTP